MRLLRWNSRNQLTLTEYLTDDVPSYAILSHTWGADRDEVTFAEVQQGRGQSKAGYAKIQFCGKQARKDGIEHFWVDTCCINKADHVELSEAITSMFRWYREAKKCYVYLPDVSTRKSDGDGDTPWGWESSFRASRWFTRGWTLQELLAPTVVEFFSREEDFLGTKITLAQQVHESTTIPLAALQDTPLSKFPIIERIRWSEKRNTKKKEDKAYCLLGIFDVFMPLIYGEGDNALRRLQKEIDERFGQNVAASLSDSYKTRSLGLCLDSAPLIKPEDFVGRTAEINNVYSILRPDSVPVEQRRVVLGGMGGMGKTQLAIAYARRHERSYTSILWFNASSELTLSTSFQSVARALMAADALEKLDDEQILTRVHEWLSQPRNTEWLLIFDNHDDPDQFDISRFYPNTSYGSVIVTTRLPDLVTGPQVRVQSLIKMSDSLNILQARSGRLNVRKDAGACRLAQRLAGLPLALVTAGAYLRKSTMTFQQYLDIYEQRWQVDPRRPLRLLDYQDRTLYTT